MKNIGKAVKTGVAFIGIDKESKEEFQRLDDGEIYVFRSTNKKKLDEALNWAKGKYSNLVTRVVDIYYDEKAP